MTDDEPMTDTITISVLDGAAAREVADEIRDLYADVYAEPPYNEGPDDVAGFVGRFDKQTRGRGFTLAAARDSGRLVGMAYVATLDAGRWWGGALAEPPADVQAVDKAGLYELAVRAPYRGRGIARRLVDVVLDGRAEPWAVLLVNPEVPARAIYERWGWRPAGPVQPQPGWPTNEAMVLPLA